MQLAKFVAFCYDALAKIKPSQEFSRLPLRDVVSKMFHSDLYDNLSLIRTFILKKFLDTVNFLSDAEEFAEAKKCLSEQYEMTCNAYPNLVSRKMLQDISY
ncbi:unnamed protein product [Caenorhabditis bovis]|uniref:Uncharacterized protein n=1 Tax=Caenorhabditis bovis TaxID=2654633 RepID=A0A8S1EVE0_9PELO|nr:unnamed protein product [Caenorhabditis bovis]